VNLCDALYCLASESLNYTASEVDLGDVIARTNNCRIVNLSDTGFH
jgi:hypothetical protein